VRGPNERATGESPRPTMRGFEPFGQTLERFIGRRLLALLAALALADVVLLLSASLSVAAFVGVGGVQQQVRARRIEIVNAQGQPVLLAAADGAGNGVLWVGAADARGGVSIGTEEDGHGSLLLSTASGAPVVSLSAGADEGGALHIADSDGADLVFVGVGSRGAGLLLLNNDQGVNIIAVGADSAAAGGLLVNSGFGANLIFAGAGTKGNGGLRVNTFRGTDLVFIGADEQNNATIGLWDRLGQGRALNLTLTAPKQ
jgi:hypothetical protein